VAGGGKANLIGEMVHGEENHGSLEMPFYSQLTQKRRVSTSTRKRAYAGNTATDFEGAVDVLSKPDALREGESLHTEQLEMSDRSEPLYHTTESKDLGMGKTPTGLAQDPGER